MTLTRLILSLKLRTWQVSKINSTKSMRVNMPLINVNHSELDSQESMNGLNTFQMAKLNSVYQQEDSKMLKKFFTHWVVLTSLMIQQLTPCTELPTETTLQVSKRRETTSGNSTQLSITSVTARRKSLTVLP